MDLDTGLLAAEADRDAALAALRKIADAAGMFRETWEARSISEVGDMIAGHILATRHYHEDMPDCPGHYGEHYLRRPCPGTVPPGDLPIDGELLLAAIIQRHLMPLRGEPTPVAARELARVVARAGWRPADA
jgi:hypothetical protein